MSILRKKIILRLLKQLPQEIRREFGEDEAGFRTSVEELVKQGAQDVLANLVMDGRQAMVSQPGKVSLDGDES